MNRILKFSLVVVALSFATSCYDDPGTDILFEDTFVEINEATLAAGLVANKSYLRENNGIAKRDSLRINLVGPQKSTATSVSFSIDASSTAIAGLHYNLISTSPVEIPANSSFAYIYFEVEADNIELGEVWTMKVSISNPSVGSVNPNYSTFTRGLQILCPFNRANFLGVYSVVEPGYSGSPYPVTAVAGTAANAIVINNFWDFGGVVTYTFSTDAANPTVTLPTQTVVMGGDSYEVSQNGAATYSPCDYSFVVPYRVRLGGVTQDTNTHTFTKQ